MSLGYRILLWREKLGATVFEFAEICGVSPVSIRNWESDTHTPTDKNISNISSVLGITPVRLINGNPPTKSELKRARERKGLACYTKFAVDSTLKSDKQKAEERK